VRERGSYRDSTGRATCGKVRIERVLEHACGKPSGRFGPPQGSFSTKHLRGPVRRLTFFVVDVRGSDEHVESDAVIERIAFGPRGEYGAPREAIPRERPPNLSLMARLAAWSRMQV